MLLPVLALTLLINDISETFSWLNKSIKNIFCTFLSLDGSLLHFIKDKNERMKLQCNTIIEIARSSQTDIILMVSFAYAGYVVEQLYT